MNPEHHPDHDLREAFAHQRRSDHEQAPAWNPDLLRVPAKRKTKRMALWLPITATAAACALVSLVWLRDEAKPSPAPNLAEALPELFAPDGEPLFASLDSNSVSAMPSDSLLPAYLNIQLP